LVIGGKEYVFSLAAPSVVYAFLSTATTSASIQVLRGRAEFEFKFINTKEVARAMWGGIIGAAVGGWLLGGCCVGMVLVIVWCVKRGKREQQVLVKNQVDVPLVSVQPVQPYGNQVNSSTDYMRLKE